MELSQEMINRRYETVASGTFTPEIPGLPGVVFVRMGLKERGIANRSYAKKLKELLSGGDYFSESLLPSILEKTCRENGLDIGILKEQRELVKRFYENIPGELAGPIDQLTEEEAALLSLEDQSDRKRAAEERGRRIMEWQESFFSEDDRRVMEKARQIEDLEQHLKTNTAEHRAREYQMQSEILVCARRLDDQDTPYFNSIDQIAEIEDRSRDTLVQLYLKWKQFKEGLLPQFFRANRTEQPAVD